MVELGNMEFENNVRGQARSAVTSHFEETLKALNELKV